MITGIYFAILVNIYIAITLRVIRARRINRIPYGAGPHGEIANLVSAHSNFAAYAPMFLVGLFLVESTGLFSFWLLHGIAATFTIGRALHFWGLSVREPQREFKCRIMGMHMTIWPLVLLSVLNLVILLY